MVSLMISLWIAATPFTEWEATTARYAMRTNLHAAAWAQQGVWEGTALNVLVDGMPV